MKAERRWRAARPLDVTSTHGNQLSELGPAVERFVDDTRLVRIENPPHPEASARDPVVTGAAA